MKLTFLVLCITAVASGRMLTMPRPIGMPVKEIVYMTTETTTTPLPLIRDTAIEATNTVRFFKQVLSVIDTKGPQELVNNLEDEFKALDVDGKLGTTLISLYELRLEDLLVTVDHYKKMKTVLDLLTANRSS